MSLALARKYRPSIFADLVGQETVSRTLLQALGSDRLSHAYLFSGLRGSGKTSTARIFAKALICSKNQSGEPCDSCEDCSMANQSRHIDIIEMDGASNRGIDSIKELIEHTKYKPAISKYKIFIIDEVHMLTKEAFNALLKTLEEPPDFIKFILATTDPLKMPATILSRTQHFRFKKIPQKLTVNHLANILTKESVSFDVDALEIIARSGSGSLRDSITLLDQAIVFSQDHLDLKTVTDMLGIIEPSILDKLLDDLQLRNQDAILKFLNFASDYEAEMIIDEMTLHLKDQLFSQTSKFAPLIIDRLFRVLADSKQLLSLGSDGEFVLSLMLFKMMEALSLKEIDTVIKALKKEFTSIKPATQISMKESTIETNQEINQAKPNLQPEDSISTDRLAGQVPSTIEATESSTQMPSPNIQSEIPASKPQSKPAPEIPLEPKQSIESEIDKVEDLDEGAIKFKALIEKIFDRDYELGACFDANIEYKSFEDGSLSWYSSAEDDEKKLLIKHWNIIKMFVQELYGLETKIINLPSQSKKKTEVISEQKSSCIAPEATDSEATKEKNSADILEEPMIKEILEQFRPKKVRVIKNS